MHQLTLKLLPLALLVALPLAAWADRVDCSGVAKWNSDLHYKNGDLVWHHEGGNVWEKYRCEQDVCLGAGNNEPGSGPTWKRLGTCDQEPS